MLCHFCLSAEGDFKREKIVPIKAVASGGQKEKDYTS